MFDVVPMMWDLPVTVNFHEATAFAKWKSLRHRHRHDGSNNNNNSNNYRVMTELEHHAIRNKSQHTTNNSLTIMDDTILTTRASGPQLLSDREHGANFNLACSSMNPVTAMPPNERGFYDVFGNAWQWTSDYFSALQV